MLQLVKIIFSILIDCKHVIVQMIIFANSFHQFGTLKMWFDSILRQFNSYSKAIVMNQVITL